MFKVLIVEDYAITRDVLKDWLKTAVPLIKVEEAVNVKEAMEKVESSLPDLILMDIRLPDGSGLDLTKKIKGKYPAINVIVLSSYESSMFDHVARQYGADQFLSKSDISRDDLLSLVYSFSELKEKN